MIVKCRPYAIQLHTIVRGNTLIELYCIADWWPVSGLRHLPCGTGRLLLVRGATVLPGLRPGLHVSPLSHQLDVPSTDRAHRHPGNGRGAGVRSQTDAWR